MRRATLSCLNNKSDMEISTHALHAESDAAMSGLPGQHLGLHFYPRSPCGERLGYMGAISINTGISTHALHAESDRLQRALLRIFC